MVIYVTRHGQLDESAKCPNQHNLLSPLGRLQAAKLGRYLAELGFKGQVYASPLHRCLETADIICQALNLRFRPEARLCEVGLDSWIHDYIGLTAQQIAELFPSCEPNAPLPWPWWPKETEAGKVHYRVVSLVDQLLGQEDGDVLLVGHGATADASYRYLAGKSIMHYNATLSAIQMQPDRTVLLSANAAHLGIGEVTQNAQIIA